ncbi:MAG: TylF/MycF/NovP-related O-methyltransferase [Thermodesulfobacteriota bacterium]
MEPQLIADDFPMFVSRQELVRYLVRYELFKKILDIKGSVVECGVYRGASLMLFARLSAIYEPYAFKREVIGFDTFGGGFPHVDDKDGASAYAGDLADADMNILKKSIELFDRNRPVGHIPKVRLVKGDATVTIPEFFNKNPHMLVALLYLDFDLYEATKRALETIVPRMPRGAVIAFDELNDSRRPGESIALMELLNLRDMEIRKFPEEPHISYAVL